MKDKKIDMSLRELIEEHEKLIPILESAKTKAGRKEYMKQKKELIKYKKIR